MQTEKDDLKCNHAPCNCGVSEIGAYCSEECHKADQQSGQASTSSAKCPCAHNDCR